MAARNVANAPSLTTDVGTNSRNRYRDRTRGDSRAEKNAAFPLEDGDPDPDSDLDREPIVGMDWLR